MAGLARDRYCRNRVQAKQDDKKQW
jgi:hypothetical protein